MSAIEQIITWMKNRSSASAKLAELAASELAAKNERILALEIAARDFLRAYEMSEQITRDEFMDAYNALNKLVRCPECDSQILPSKFCMMGHWCGEKV